MPQAHSHITTEIRKVIVGAVCVALSFAALLIDFSRLPDSSIVKPRSFSNTGSRSPYLRAYLYESESGISAFPYGIGLRSGEYEQAEGKMIRLIMFSGRPSGFWATTHIEPDFTIVEYEHDGSPASLPDGTWDALESNAERSPYATDLLPRVQRASQNYAQPSKSVPIGYAHNALALSMFVLFIWGSWRFLTAGSAILKLRQIAAHHTCLCGYDIRGLPSLTCPECGRILSTQPAQSSTTLDA